MCILLTRSGVDSNILDIEELRKSKFGYLTLTADLNCKGQPNFYKRYIIFKVSRYSYFIYFRFVEFLDLDCVKINTKIKSVACIQPEIMKVI